MLRRTVAIAPILALSVCIPAAAESDRGVGVPGIEITDDGIRLPGVEINSEGVKMPGVNISGDDERPRRKGRRYVAADLENADFSGQDLAGAVFESSDLQNADFSGANLTDAAFVASDLANADFSGAVLEGAVFKGVDLGHADFRTACLVQSKIVGSELSHADFSGANLTGSKMVANDMSHAKTRTAVYDGAERCQTTVAAAVPRPEVTSASAIRQALATDQGQVDLTVNFAHDSDKIVAAGHVQIMEIANALRAPELDQTRVRIEGHTDDTGEAEYNLDLSYRRAITVMRALVEEYQVSSGRFEVKGFGESSPVADNGSDQGRALNRRVTLVRLN